MCGIIGYIGPQKVIPIILKGLKSSEYRGYDSSGITFYSKDGFQRIRSEGYLSKLEAKIPYPDTSEHIGMGHTRWATHGVPNETNAHPQKFEKIHVVHNGVIENAYSLKKKFPASYKSQTDTEIIARLINHFQPQKDFKNAVLQTLLQLKGQFAFLTLSESSPHHLIGCRNGPPLILGVGNNKEFFISSDLPSLSHWTQKVYILEDQEMFEIQNGVCRFYSFEGTPIKKEILNTSEVQSEVHKDTFRDFMLKEIFDQPTSLQSTLQNISFSIRKNNLLREKIKNSRKIHIIACGSSFYAGLYGKYIIEHLAQIPVEVELASEFQYRSTLVQKEDSILFISQSGETADILSCVKKAQTYKVFCMALCNVQNSSLDRMVHETLLLKSGVEKAVASTKAFTSSLSALFVLALELAHSKPSKESQEMFSHLQSLPQYSSEVLKQNETLKKLAQTFTQFKSFLFLGRGHHYPISLEGALKLKELAYVHAEGYPFGEMKHGPLALVDDHVLTIGLTSQGTYFNKNLINLEEIKARKGHILTIGSSSSHLKNISLHHISIPQTHFLLSPILEILPLQLIAYHYALHLNHNPDQPRNLAKSVTVE